MTAGPAAVAVPPLRLGPLLASGVVDSTGLAFGWTIILLMVTDRGGLGAAALQSAAMLVGIALSAPFSAWLSTRLSPRDLLRSLAVAEGACRLGVFVLLWAHADGRLMAPVVVAMNVFAWSAFAGMRSEVARAEEAAGSGRSLTWYAVAIASSEALAAGAAALLLDSMPSAPVLTAVTVLYALSLLPQWWVGTHADPVRHPQPAAKAQLQAVIGPVGLGGAVFLLAGAPALLATVLAYELYGSTGVVVSALAFTAGSLGAARLQAGLSRWQPSTLSAFVLGALMIGGWSLSEASLLGLAVAQGCAGLAQCSLEGDLDTRVVARVQPGAVTAGLALAASARALGGALAVAVLPTLLEHTSLPRVSTAGSSLLVLVAVGVGLNYGMHPSRRQPASFAVGYAAGVVTGVVTDVAIRVRETAGVSRASMSSSGRR